MTEIDPPWDAQGGEAGKALARGPQAAGGADRDSGDPELRGFYSDFFGFTERPFTLLPDPDMLMWSPQHRRAFSVLEYGIHSRSPVTLLTGAIGCGKTTLLRELLREIDPGATVGLVSNAQGGRGALLQWVLNALSQKFAANSSYVFLFQQLQDFLIAEYAAGRRVTLIFDEAQNLSMEGLEELRMLTNINTGKDEVVQLVLVGQPELADTIRRPELAQLAQRIAVSYHLLPLDAAMTGNFIVHRLVSAGGTGEEFDLAARKLVYEVTCGVPRLINQFCDMALLYAWTNESPIVTTGTLEQVLEDNVFFAAQLKDRVETGKS